MIHSFFFCDYVKAFFRIGAKDFDWDIVLIYPFNLNDELLLVAWVWIIMQYRL